MRATRRLPTHFVPFRVHSNTLPLLYSLSHPQRRALLGMGQDRQPMPSTARRSGRPVDPQPAAFTA